MLRQLRLVNLGKSNLNKMKNYEPIGEVIIFKWPLIFNRAWFLFQNFCEFSPQKSHKQYFLSHSFI